MTQRDQVIEVMERHGGFATLGQLYQKVDVRKWGAENPRASIRRIVQNKKHFFKIRLGLWALNSHRAQLDFLTLQNHPKAEKEKLDHYYYQGLLLQIGNIKNFQTYTPDQDKNKSFLDTTLGEVRKLQRIHTFSYKDTVSRARMIDVMWFNRRNMPHTAFEVEHSTDFTNALSKYIALQDFNMTFYVVSSQHKRQQFSDKISRDEYYPIKQRVKFLNYDKLVEWHGKSMQINDFGDMP